MLVVPSPKASESAAAISAKQALQKAFDAAAVDSGLHDAESAGLLDHRALRSAIKEFGLGGETNRRNGPAGLQH